MITEPKTCKECGGEHLTWQSSIINRSNVQQGRLTTSDVECLFFLGCDDCSETLATVSADKMAGLMNASRPPVAPEAAQADDGDVTEEMIQAGIAALTLTAQTALNAELAVTTLYRAMHDARAAAVAPSDAKDATALTDEEIIDVLWDASGRGWKPSPLPKPTDKIGYIYEYRQLIAAFRVLLSRSPTIAAGQEAANAKDAALSQAARDVLAERQRQTQGFYDVGSDDRHVLGELAAYACAYAMPEGTREWPAHETGYGETWGEAIVPEGWHAPRLHDRRDQLVRAGALILAEIERMDRGALRDAEPKEKTNV